MNILCLRLGFCPSSGPSRCCFGAFFVKVCTRLIAEYIHCLGKGSVDSTVTKHVLDQNRYWPPVHRQRRVLWQKRGAFWNCMQQIFCPLAASILIVSVPPLCYISFWPFFFKSFFPLYLSPRIHNWICAMERSVCWDSRPQWNDAAVNLQIIAVSLSYICWQWSDAHRTSFYSLDWEMGEPWN